MPNNTTDGTIPIRFGIFARLMSIRFYRRFSLRLARVGRFGSMSLRLGQICYPACGWLDPDGSSTAGYQPSRANMRQKRIYNLRERLRVKSNLLNRFKLIWVVQSVPQIYSASTSPQISSFLRAVPPRQEGRIAVVTNARRDAVDARASARKVVAGRDQTRERLTARKMNDARCVRQNRVVLAPVAGVKLAEVLRGPTGFPIPSIRRRWRQEEFVSRESTA